ncbi:MAG: rRNA pseudouridine synthase [Betaproteobacteria bacterium]|nr:rRNA pseudouridine synthase [Betaproteobacteria bacterium]
MASGPVRLQKLLAAAGLGSRREIEDWIAAGRLAVGGRVAQLGDRAGPGDKVTLDGRTVELPRESRSAPRVLMYHKPVGEIVSMSDPEGRPSVFTRLPRLRGAKWIAIGRLDLTTSGLLLFTDNGDLANQLMHPRYGFEREYRVRVLGKVEDSVRRSMLSGVDLDGKQARFERLEALHTERGDAANRWYRVVLMEGRYREVRRVFEAVGLQVSRLMRVRFGSINLPEDLAAGHWVELPPRQIDHLLEGGGPGKR